MRYFFITTIIFINFCFVGQNVKAAELTTDYVFSGKTGTADDLAGQTGLSVSDPREIAAKVINVILGFLGIIAVMIVIMGGFMWMTAQGNEEKITKAKQLLISGVIGMIIVLSAFGIARFVINSLLGATGAGTSSSSSGATVPPTPIQHSPLAGSATQPAASLGGAVAETRLPGGGGSLGASGGNINVTANSYDPLPLDIEVTSLYLSAGQNILNNAEQRDIEIIAESLIEVTATDKNGKLITNPDSPIIFYFETSNMSERVRVGYFNEDMNEWEYINVDDTIVDSDEGTVTAFVSHLTKFALLLPPDNPPVTITNFYKDPENVNRIRWQVGNEDERSNIKNFQIRSRKIGENVWENVRNDLPANYSYLDVGNEENVEYDLVVRYKSGISSAIYATAQDLGFTKELPRDPNSKPSRPSGDTSPKRDNCLTERTQEWEDFMELCEQRTNQLIDQGYSELNWKIEPRFANNNDFCVDEDWGNCRWQEAEETQGYNQDCQGQYLYCNAYYKEHDEQGSYTMARTLPPMDFFKNYVGKQCADENGQSGYCNITGQCVAETTCNAGANENSCNLVPNFLATLITNAIIAAPAQCPVNNCKEDINQLNKTACDSKKVNKDCAFSQYNKGCKSIITNKGVCSNEKGNLICTPKQKECPAGYKVCGNGCQASYEECIGISFMAPDIPLSDKNNCPNSFKFCSNDNSKVVKKAKDKGVCCSAETECGIDNIKGYAFCTKKNQCNEETEIECKGGIWKGSVNLNLTNLSFCCDKETEQCYATDTEINGVEVGGFEGWPLCINKDGGDSCGENQIQCNGLGKYKTLFACCENGKEYCAHYSEDVPLCAPYKE